MRISLFPKTRRGLNVILALLAALLFLYGLFAVFARVFPDNELLSSGYFADLLFKGIVLGSVYALIALGYTMVYGVIQLINFAHGEIYMLGAYFGYFFLRVFIDRMYIQAGVPLWIVFILAMFTAMICCAICGIAMEKFAYLPLRKSTRIAALITAVGMSFFLQNLGLIVFTANPRSFAPNTFVVYTIQIDETESFNSPRTKRVYSDTRALMQASGDVYVRVSSSSQAGKSGWSDPVFLPSGSLAGVGELANYSSDLSEGIPAPKGILLTRDINRGQIEIKWSEIPKVFRDVKPIFGEKTSFVPLDFGLGAGMSDGTKRFGFNASQIHLVILITTFVMLFGLYWLIHKTKFGVAMRAVSFDKDATKLMGINTDNVISITFALGSALAAVAGCLVGLYLVRIDPLMGVLPGIKAFVAAVLGGIGSVPGAAAGGFIMGVTETLVKGYIPARISPLSDAVAFAFLIIVLIFKPTGLFGRVAKEKV